MKPLLDIRKLGLSYRSGRREQQILSDISLSLNPGERLAILGESGSGKSSLANTVSGLVPVGATLAGEITWPALGRPPKLGSDIGFVFQDPAGSLDPLMRVGEQIAEVLRFNGFEADARDRTLDLLERVRLPEPAYIARAYPHQLSGGQKQRIAIACAIAAEPRLLIADEATSALDTIVQAEILSLLQEFVSSRNMALMLITHDIAIAAGNADRIAILQDGNLVEIGETRDVLHHPKSEHARRLLAAHIPLDAPPRVGELMS